MVAGAIGSFVIGESQIGSPAWDFTPTILSQYANSPTIISLLQSFSAWFDQNSNIDNFYDKVWNVDTAVGFGLDIWGRIVGIGRTWPIATSNYFDFQGTDGVGFNQAPFWSGSPATTNFTFSDDAYRRLILAKAFANICDGTTPQINQLLLSLFPNRGNCFVIDNQDNSLTYSFNFVPTPVDLTIILKTGILPKPAGISILVNHL